MWASAMVACVAVVSAGLLRRWPLLALALLLAVPVVASTLDAMRLGLGLLVLFYAAGGIEVCFIAATRPRRISLIAVLMVFGVPVIFLAVGPDIPVQLDVVVLLTTVIAWLAGHSVRQAAVRAEERRALAQAQAAVTERLRIARELHDMVAHSIGIIAIQAGVGRRVIDTQPAEARNALTAIEATSRETLAGLRQMLGVLRRGPGQHGRRPAGASTRPGRPRPARRHRAGRRRPRRAALARPAAPAARRRRPVRLPHHPGVGDQRGPARRDRALPGDRRLPRLASSASRSPTTGAAAHRPPKDRARAAAVFGIDGMRERACLLGGELTAGPRPAAASG